jgi:glutamate dehydrogenase
MVYFNNDSKETIINKVIAIAKQKLPKNKLPLISKFIQYYFAAVAQEDLLDRDPIDLYGAALSHWNLLNERTGNKEVIHIFNPSFEQHGWQSKHTVIEIATNSMPFLVDSLRIVLNRFGLTVHMIIHPGAIILKRDDNNEIIDIEESNKPAAKIKFEEPVYVEIDRQTDPAFLKQLKKSISDAFDDIKYAVQDWPHMKSQAEILSDELKALSSSQASPDLNETLTFLRWMTANHFTFLGCCDFDLTGKEKDTLKIVEDSKYGLYRKGKFQPNGIPAEGTPEGRTYMSEDDRLITFEVYSEPSSVHRPTMPYCISVKRFTPEGKLLGERRFIGHFTSSAYFSAPKAIPFLRRKVERIIELSSFYEQSHSGRELINILETFPRDDLFLSKEQDLFDVVMGIMHLQERQRVRLFVLRDQYDRYFSCLIYIPKERYNSRLRQHMSQILMSAFNGIKVTFSPRFSESILARLHVVVHLKLGTVAPPYDLNDIENKLIEAERTWQDNLHDALLEHFGEAKGIDLNNKYYHAFNAGYCEHYSARTAVYDIEHMEELHDESELGMSFYQPLEQYQNRLCFKLFGMNNPIPLSDVLPILEHLGFRVIAEHSHEITLFEDRKIWINEFDMLLNDVEDLDVDKVREIFQDAFSRVWVGDAENDGFNRLVLLAKLNWRETALLRTYAKYFKQIGFTFSQSYIENTLNTYPKIAKDLVELFHIRFNPHEKKAVSHYKVKIEAINVALDEVKNIDEDRILRQYLHAIKSTLRTNFYQHDKDTQKEKNYISIKLNPSNIPDVPLPHPAFEIFVYSPRVEAVHLRAGKVARGGLRWSDRREDFRTEVLGLMKAQQVKNAVIVPTGAKGGFVPKLLANCKTREETMKEVIECYSTFIRGMLDITDNLDGDTVVPPIDVVRHDKDDTYLVVAADKGTATFSDIANGIAAEYHFWLDDAFASGGSHGYDHKKMGITARGAWESVRRNFREFNKNPDADIFTAVGVGDMSGDVFGNGMILSNKMKLVAAFNHQNIFIDPNPDPEKTFAERVRLFNLPRSTWEDYNLELLSEGGGIYSRSSKSIKISAQAKSILDLKKTTVTANELVRAILKAPVDLLWNGGIGTYVKSSKERNADVGDRSNDAVRIDGNELRCKVVAEGGNLGLTQLGRIEYALANGISFTDFIDNSGGVDCSDKEVNIKILLNAVVTNGDMTQKQRNQLLFDMTDEVALRVLEDNYQQTQAISFAFHRASVTLDEYMRFIAELERVGKLNRELEFLPDDEELARRKALGLGLTRPEIAILLSYSKNLLKEEILASDIPEEKYLNHFVHLSLPKQLGAKFTPYLNKHRLHREISANFLANMICNKMGATFMKRVYDETGASVVNIVKAFVAAHDIFEMDTFWHYIRKLDATTPSRVQYQMMTDVVRLVRRATRWIVRNRRLGIDIKECVNHFKGKVDELYVLLPKLLIGVEMERFEQVTKELVKQGVPQTLALRVAGAGPMISALDIIEASSTSDFSIKAVANMYFALGARLKLDWFRQELGIHPVANSWDALARAACRDDLDRQQRGITASILSTYKTEKDIDVALDAWQAEHQLLVDRWMLMIADLKAAKKRDYNMFTVALRELLDLVQASISSTQKAVKHV